MNILQKLESKLTPKSTDEAVDKELEDYTVEEIQRRIYFYQRTIVGFEIGAFLTGGFAVYFVFRNVLSWFMQGIVCMGNNTVNCQNIAETIFYYYSSQELLGFGLLLLTLALAIKIYQFHKIEEALESGLKRKIENNKNGETL